MGDMVDEERYDGDNKEEESIVEFDSFVEYINGNVMDLEKELNNMDWGE